MSILDPATETEAEAGPFARPSSNMRSLSRALEIFELLQRSDKPQRLSDIARLSKMSPPTTLRLLRVLQDFNLVSQNERTYRIGPAVLPAAQSFLESDPLVTLSRPILQQLAHDVGVTASLYSRLGFDRVLIARVEGSDPIRYELPLGRRLPLTRGAAGKALLASASDQDLSEVVAASVELGREADTFTLEELRTRLPEPGQAFALSANERATGLISIAIAVANPRGPVRESIALTSSVEASDEAAMKAMLPDLTRAARSLSERLATHVY